jgi:hypothetical protein
MSAEVRFEGVAMFAKIESEGSSQGSGDEEQAYLRIMTVSLAL